MYENIGQVIGKTPLVRIGGASQESGANIYGKLESMNPVGSIKDRVGLYLITEGEKAGKIKEGTRIIEPTSGNTGVGLAAIAAQRGYKAIFTMPETMSVERQKLLKAFGATVVLTEGAKGMKGAIAKAKELASSMENTFIPGQFDNMASVKAHYETTGPEIWEETQGKVDIFVSAIGTGGTVTGVGTFFKEQRKDILVVGVEPKKSPVLSGGSPGPHKIQGIGAGFVPNILDKRVIDQVVTVSEEDSFFFANQLAKKEGILCGISSGAALVAAIEIGKQEENKGKNIVVILPDTGERYLSSNLFL